MRQWLWSYVDTLTKYSLLYVSTVILSFCVLCHHGTRIFINTRGTDKLNPAIGVGIVCILSFPPFLSEVGLLLCVIMSNWSCLVSVLCYQQNPYHLRKKLIICGHYMYVLNKHHFTYTIYTKLIKVLSTKTTHYIHYTYQIDKSFVN